MKVMDVLKRIKGGERVMVSLTKRDGAGKKYHLTDGTEVSSDQFEKLSDFLTPSDAGLFDDSEPQSYIWGG